MATSGNGRRAHGKNCSKKTELLKSLNCIGQWSKKLHCHDFYRAVLKSGHFSLIIHSHCSHIMAHLNLFGIVIDIVEYKLFPSKTKIKFSKNFKPSAITKLNKAMKRMQCVRCKCVWRREHVYLWHRRSDSAVSVVCCVSSRLYRMWKHISCNGQINLSIQLSIYLAS